MNKIIKKDHIFNMSLVDLQGALVSYKKSLFKIRFNDILTKNKDTSLIKKNKKIIARIKTKINYLKIKLSV